MRTQQLLWRIGWIALLLLGLLVLARYFIAYQPANYNPMPGKKTAMREQILEMTLGEKGDDIVKRAGFPIKRSQISTALLFDASRSASKVEIIFRLKHSQHGLELPTATDVEFYDGVEDDLGVTYIDVIIKPPPYLHKVEDPEGPQVEAYDRAIYQLVSDVLSRIRQAGWKRYISPYDPRLQGAASYPFIDGYGPDRGGLDILAVDADPGYVLSWNDWRHLQSGGVDWQWYVPGIFLRLQYGRDDRETGQPVIDELQATFQTEDTFLLQSGRQGDHLAEAKIAHARHLPQRLKHRAEEEAKARAAGLPILESYQDPPIGGIPIPSHIE